MSRPYRPMTSEQQRPIAPPSGWNLNPERRDVWDRFVAEIRVAGFDVDTVGDLQGAFRRTRPGETRGLGQLFADYERHPGSVRPIIGADGAIIPAVTTPDVPGRPARDASLPPGVPDTPAGRAALRDLRTRLEALGHTDLNTAEGLTRAFSLSSGTGVPTDYSSRVRDPSIGVRDEVAFSGFFSRLSQDGPVPLLSELTKGPNGQAPAEGALTSSVRCPVAATPSAKTVAPNRCG
jgi:hypothetical protein